jgi:zinc transporter ZupT
VLLAFVAATIAAVVCGWVVQRIPLLPILAFPYGFIVAEVALRAGDRSRSRAMQVATGLAAFIGGVVGAALILPSGMPDEAAAGFYWQRATYPYPLLLTIIGVAVAVSRVRYL